MRRSTRRPRFRAQEIWRRILEDTMLDGVARERIGELLLKSGVLTQGQLVAALREQQRTGVRLGQILVDHGMVEEATLYDALAKMTNLDRFNLRTALLEKSALNLVAADVALEQGVVPFRVDVVHKTLHVAMTDPTNLKTADDLAFRTNLKVKVHVASETEIQRVVRHHFYGDPLDRDPRNVNRPSGPRHTGDIDESGIIYGMDKVRDEIHRQSTPMPPPPLSTPAPPPLPPPDAAAPAPAMTTADLSDRERAALARLKPIFETQDEAARALWAIFELCVARGVIRREEYLERLRKAEQEGA